MKKYGGGHFPGEINIFCKYSYFILMCQVEEGQYIQWQWAFNLQVLVKIPRTTIKVLQSIQCSEEMDDW